MLASLVLAMLAQANPSAAPIHVDECFFERSGSFEHSVRIRFHNTSSRVATTVTFDVHNGPHSVTVSDHGKFAPNVTIDHALATPTWELYHAEPHSCVVTHVRFVDGSTWGTERK